MLPSLVETLTWIRRCAQQQPRVRLQVSNTHNEYQGQLISSNEHVAESRITLHLDFKRCYTVINLCKVMTYCVAEPGMEQ